MTPWLSSGALRKRLPPKAPTPWSTSMMRLGALVKTPVTLRVALALLSPPATLVSSMVPLLVKAGVIDRVPGLRPLSPCTRRMEPGPVVKLPPPAAPMLLLVKRATRVPLLTRGALIGVGAGRIEGDVAGVVVRIAGAARQGQGGGVGHDDLAAGGIGDRAADSAVDAAEGRDGAAGAVGERAAGDAAGIELNGAGA